MQTYETLKHTTWDCKYHVVFITKCRKKTLYGQIRRELGPVFRELARQKECDIIEGHLMPDHVHMLVAIPPKYSVAQVVGFLKGKTAIHIARVYGGRCRSFVGQQFWARSYWVSTVGRDEVAVRRYIVSGKVGALYADGCSLLKSEDEKCSHPSSNPNGPRDRSHHFSLPRQRAGVGAICSGTRNTAGTAPLLALPEATWRGGPAEVAFSEASRGADFSRDQTDQRPAAR